MSEHYLPPRLAKVGIRLLASRLVTRLVGKVDSNAFYIVEPKKIAQPCGVQFSFGLRKRRDRKERSATSIISCDHLEHDIAAGLVVCE